MTLAPLPEISTLLVSLLSNESASHEDAVIAKPWCREGDIPFSFSRSAWAMQALVLSWEQRHRKSKPRIWVPDYFCNQSLWPLRQTSAQIEFYSIDTQLQPKWDLCFKRARQLPPDLFILTHYFGQPADSAQARKFCDSFHCLLVEDAAHVLTPISGIGEAGDFVFYSPHKQLAIPDGAFLIIRPRAKDQFLLSFQEIRGQLNPNFPSPWIWMGKRLVQKIIFHPRKQKTHSFLEDPIATPLPSPSRLSPLSRKLLLSASFQLPEIALKRRAHEAKLRQELFLKQGFQPLIDFEKSQTTPYLAVFRCSDVKEARAKFEEYRKKRIPIQSWPDLPPEIRSNPEIHCNAIDLRQTSLTFPIHQSLRNKDLLFFSYRANKEKGMDTL